MNKIDIENLFYIDSIEGYYLVIKNYNPVCDLIIADNKVVIPYTSLV